jgi:hypothetical protein
MGFGKTIEWAKRPSVEKGVELIQYVSTLYQFGQLSNTFGIPMVADES